MAETITVDFGRPIPIFPLPGVVLLPHAVQGLHVFEPRYRQMVEDALEEMEDENLLTAGPIAMATLVQGSTLEDVFGAGAGGGAGWGGSEPPLRPAVCVGKMVQHQPLADGRHNLLLHGVCRAKITRMLEPEGERLYRTAYLEPLERIGPTPPALPGVRGAIKALLTGSRLKRLAAADAVLQWIRRDDLPTHALVELVGFTLVLDEGVRYRLLSEPSAAARATLVRNELARLEGLVGRAEGQSQGRWPKGVSWN